MTDKCAYPKCGKELIHMQGRKKKKYCDADCKLKHWQILNPVKKEPKRKSIPIEQWKEIEAVLEKSYAENKEEIKKVMDDATFCGVAISKTDTDGKVTRIDPLSQEGYEVRVKAERIQQLEKELKNIPATLKIPKKMYISIREKELAELKSKTN
jgi:hypothetical protein